MNNLLIIGSLNMDTVIDVTETPRPGETVLGKKYELCPGGKGANQAYAAGKLGAGVSMIGTIGDDGNGMQLLKNLQSVGVDTEGIQKLDHVASGTAFITVNEAGENSIIVIPGANFLITKEYIDQHINIIDACDILIVQLEIPIEVVSYVVKLAKSKNKLVILDPAPAPKELPLELIRNVDILKPNETELQALTGMETTSVDQIVTAARSLLAQGVKKVVVTIGSLGTILVSENDFELFPARKVDAVDTTAAGDAFTAAFAMRLVEGFSYEEAIKFGNIVSSIVVTRKGAQNSIPDYEEAMKVYQTDRKEPNV
ncbi:MAG: ribokinase [Mobilitalea sp.]